MRARKGTLEDEDRGRREVYTGGEVHARGKRWATGLLLRPVTAALGSHYLAALPVR